MSDYAKADFEPWPKPEDGKLAPSHKTMVDCAVWARTANAVMCRTKEQLVEMFDKMDIEDIDRMMAGMAETEEVLKAIIIMLSSAYLRILAAASAHEIAKSAS